MSPRRRGHDESVTNGAMEVVRTCGAVDVAKTDHASSALNAPALRSALHSHLKDVTMSAFDDA